MIPYLCAVIAMLAWGWVSDRLDERRWTACLVPVAGLVIAA
jgi:sugar phosphate permease